MTCPLGKAVQQRMKDFGYETVTKRPSCTSCTHSAIVPAVVHYLHCHLTRGPVGKRAICKQWEKAP